MRVGINGMGRIGRLARRSGRPSGRRRTRAGTTGSTSFT
jgi:hypothetical protein